MQRSQEKVRALIAVLEKKSQEMNMNEHLFLD